MLSGALTTKRIFKGLSCLCTSQFKLPVRRQQEVLEVVNTDLFKQNVALRGKEVDKHTHFPADLHGEKKS